MRQAPVYRWVTDSSGHRTPLCIGQLRQSATHWAFAYGEAYLALGDAAWELDPTEIRLKQRSVFTRPGVAPFGVFCDVALSGWSLDALHKRRVQLLGEGASDEPWGWWERLLYAPADGFGALFVGAIEDKPHAENVLADSLSMVSMESLAQASLESSSGAMGGERPKIAAFLKSKDADETTPVLLKFALPSERSDSVVAEATALTLAHDLGLRVPMHRVDVLNAVPALCIERFDRETGLSGPAHHCVSAATALGLMPGSDVDDLGRSYVRLRSKLRQPGDALELFRRIVLNAAVGNTDDHPWNTSLRQVGLRTWELSPLYDVMPFFNRSGVPVFRMAIGQDGARTGSQANLLKAGRQIGGLRSDAEGQAVIDEIFGHCRERWRQVFERHAVQVGNADASAWASVFEPNLDEVFGRRQASAQTVAPPSRNDRMR